MIKPAPPYKMLIRAMNQDEMDMRLLQLFDRGYVLRSVGVDPYFSITRRYIAVVHKDLSFIPYRRDNKEAN